MVMHFTHAAQLARKMIRDGGNDSRSSYNAEKPKLQTEVIMSRALKSFAEMSLKVVAVRAADDSDFGFEFPASGPQTTPSALTTPLDQPAEVGRDSQAEYRGWHHGGLNE
jgi:hypothetical protein